MKEITIPKKLEPLVKAFYADSPEMARSLVLQSANAIYGIRDDPGDDHMLEMFSKQKQLTPDELEEVCALMGSIRPVDMVEALFAAQIIVSHMLGMRKMAKGYNEDVCLGLRLLRFSNDALCQLQKKRSGNIQNITVNYNHNGQGAALMQTILPAVGTGEGRICQ